MSLTHHDIQAILKILDDSAYDELTLEQDGYTLYLKRTAEGWTQQQHVLKAPSFLRKQESSAANIDSRVRGNDEAKEPAASEPGLVDLRSPIVGTFYRAPQPGAAPFVEIGATVHPDTVIAIIEVMKLMNSIPAKAAGIVREIHAQDGQLVEKGQLLMRVKP